MGIAANDPEGQTRIAAFLQSLQQLGWTDGRNVQIDTRWGAGDADRLRRIRGGVGRSSTRRYLGVWRFGGGAIATGDPHRANCLHADS